MTLFFFIIILILSAVIYFLINKNKKLKSKDLMIKPDIKSNFLKFKNIGELSVFKINAREIITCEDDAFKGIFNTIFGWAFTKKQISIVFDFEVDFVYDFQDQKFNIERKSEDDYKIIMPECKFKYSIKDMKIYDEKASKFMPFLLPDSLNQIGSRFSAEDKNKLIEAAKKEIEQRCSSFDEELKDKIHISATNTIETMAKNFGAKKIEFEFSDQNLISKGDNILADNENVVHKVIELDQ